MPKVDFDKVEEMDDFSPVPAGTYPCKLVEVEDGHLTKYDDEMWRLRFEIVDGEFKGKKIPDNLVFSEAAMKRVKFICSRLGISTKGKVNLTPDLLRDRFALVTVDVEQYSEEDESGNTKTKNVNKVPFNGYARWDGDGTPAQEDTSANKLPF